MTRTLDATAQHPPLWPCNISQPLALVCFWGLAVARFFDLREIQLAFVLAGCFLLLAFMATWAIWPTKPSLPLQFDYALVLVWATELLSFVTSTYRRNSLSGLYDLVTLSVLYCICRYFIVEERWLRSNIIGLGILGSTAACIQAWGASHWFKSASAIGFTDMAALKAWSPTYISPLLNDWPTIVLLLFPFAIFIGIAGKGKRATGAALAVSIACTAILVTSLVFTLSRGGFIGLAVFSLTLAIGLGRSKTEEARNVLVVLGCSIVISALSVWCMARPVAATVIHTVEGKQSVSQQRSTKSRFAVWNSAMNIGKHHLLFGVGSNNFGLTFESRTEQDQETPFGGRTLNTPLQIFAERGLCGLISFGVFFAAILLRAHRLFAHSCSSVRRCYGGICIATLIAVVVRELTYSSLLISAQASLLLWVLLASIRTEAAPQNSQTRPHTRGLIQRSAEGLYPCVCIAFFSGGVAICQVTYHHLIAAEEASVGTSHLLSGQHERAVAFLSTALKDDPSNAYIESLLALAEGQIALKPVSEEAFTGAGVEPASEMTDALESSVGSYRRALTMNPRDDNFANNLAWLYFYTGDYASAEKLFRRAVNLNAGEAAYHIGFGVLLETTRDFDGATREYSIGLSLDPEFAQSSGFRELERKYPVQAQTIVADTIRTLKAQTARTGSPIFMARLGSMLLARGRSREAIPELQNALTQLPGLSVAWKNLATALDNVDEPQQAKVALRKALFLQDSMEEPSNGGGQDWIWLHPTEHARRIPVLYMSSPLVPDDVLPPGFLDACTPST